MTRLIIALLILLLPASSTSLTQQRAAFADLILHNAVIWTVDDANPNAEAAAIKDGRFLAVGKNREILAHRGPQTEVIDLKGQFVLPGFNDNHVHFAQAAAFLEFNIMAVSTQKEFVARVRDVVAKLAPGEWIVGGYWGAYDQWDAGSAGAQRRATFTPDIALIEDLTRRHPLFIRRFDDGEFAANRAALTLAGLNPDNPVSQGIEFLRAGNGKPNGIMRGRGAQALFSSRIPRRFSRARRVEQTRRALAEIRRFGVTNVSDMSDDEQLDIYRELHSRGELTVRIHFRPGLDRWNEMAERGVKVGAGDAWIRLGALKGHIDGIMGTSSARFFKPYTHDAQNRGRWRPLMVDEKGEFVEGKFLKYMLDADRAGLQLTVHAIGDEANHLLLDYLAELEKQNGRRDRRFRLVHAQVIAPEDFARLGSLGVVAEVQPFHLSDDMRWMEERIGRERCRGAYAFRTISRSGAVLSFGTDWPGTSAAEYPINPMLGLYAAVTRQTVKGEPAGGWFPDERITIAEAIKAYTYNTAYANFEENTKGSIAVGKLADLAVLDRNLLKIPAREILQTQVVFTIVDGQVVYRR
ncbi:MAG: amidohydrolase [Acidobacteria bacterium]|nr:amidohydrolase [Acidobacteriota bacterium]MCW5970733.1 amidohydrolase [Blastocatellales bacterium]